MKDELEETLNQTLALIRGKKLFLEDEFRSCKWFNFIKPLIILQEQLRLSKKSVAIHTAKILHFTEMEKLIEKLTWRRL